MRQKIFAGFLLFVSAACTTTQGPVTPRVSFSPTDALPTPAAIPTAITLGERFTLRDLPGTGRRPVGLALLDGKVYAVNAGTNNVAVIQENRVVKFIDVGKNPEAITVDPLEKRLYILNTSDRTISIIRNDQVIATQKLTNMARMLLFFENRLFVGAEDSSNILVLDPATLQLQATVTIPNGFSIISLAGDALHHRLYTNLYDKTAVIDSASLRVLSTIPLKGSYMTNAPSPQANTLFLTNFESETQSQFLVEVDPASGAHKGRVKITGDPRGAVLNDDGSRIFLVNAWKSNLMVIDTRDLSVIATIPLGKYPTAIALDENARRVYIGNSESDSVTVVSTDNQQIVATIPLGMNPSALVANEAAGRVYITNGSSDSVFVVEGARVVKEIGVGRDPVDLARDAGAKRILIANQSDATLSILNEEDLSIRSTQPITDYVSTVQVDESHARVFVNDVILDMNLMPTGRLVARGFTVNSFPAPIFLRVNPNNHRIYAMASNGVPGSNGRIVTYSIDGDSLQQRTALPGNGTTVFLAIDPETNRVYLAETHPLAITHHLTAFDADDKRLISLPLPARVSGLVYNPQTHHLFLAHGSSGSSEAPPPPGDNTVQVFDVRTFGEVARLPLPRAGKMARLGSTIYVAGSDGTVTLIQDAVVPAPPAPTATFTPTPFPTVPTWTPGPPRPTFVITPSLLRPSVTPRASLNCAVALAAPFAQGWVGDVVARLGCPSENARTVNFATQNFERGRMFYREDEKKIYVLTDDKSWVAFEDKWTNALPEDSCPQITVGSGQTKPKRGFGKVWCENLNVRAKIDAATAPERGPYAATVQRFERGWVFGGPENTNVWVLGDEGRWE